MADYTNIDPLEFLRATQRHAAPAQAQPQQQQLPPVGANGGGQSRMSGQVGSYFGPASQALMQALTGAGGNPQASIAAMTQNPALADAVNGPSGSYTPRQTVSTPRIQWGPAGSDPSATTVTGGQPLAQPTGGTISYGGPAQIAAMAGGGGAYTPQTGATTQRIQWPASNAGAGQNNDPMSQLPAALQGLFH